MITETGMIANGNGFFIKIEDLHPMNFRKNAEHTVGFAACDVCPAGEQKPYRTYQDGDITLCEEHYLELKDDLHHRWVL